MQNTDIYESIRIRPELKYFMGVGENGAKTPRGINSLNFLKANAEFVLLSIKIFQNKTPKKYEIIEIVVRMKNNKAALS